MKEPENLQSQCEIAGEYSRWSKERPGVRNQTGPREPSMPGEPCGGEGVGMYARPAEYGPDQGQTPLSYLPLPLGPCSPWGHAENTEGQGVPRQHDSCGLVHGRSGTRRDTRCSPPRCYYSSAEPAQGDRPVDELRVPCLTLRGPLSCPTVLQESHTRHRERTGSPWEDSAENSHLNGSDHRAQGPCSALPQGGSVITTAAAGWG